MSAKIDISPEQLAIVQGILRDHLPKGTLAWAFGSRVTWTAKPFSDLDIALEGAAPLPADVLIDLEEAFEASDLPWKVDVIDLNAVSPEFRAIVERQRVPADWVETSIGELCHRDLIELQTGPFGSQLHAHEYVDIGVPVVPTEAIRERRINYAVLPQIPEEKAASLGRHRLKEGDILFARRGVQATGHTAFVRKPDVGFVCGTGAIRLRVLNDETEVDAEYLSHLFADQASVAWFKFHAIGATMPNLNEGIIKSFPVFLPGFDEQKRIGNFLSALDDKIELNRRMNETLEAMARAVFRDWFVDFGPTRRKAAGITDAAAILGGLLPDPTQATPLAALFPDCFGAGGLPDGWQKRTLGDLVEPRKGRNITKKTVVPGDVPVVAGGLNPAYYHNTPNVTGPVITASASGANAGFVRLYHQDIWASDCSFISREQTDYLFTIYALLSSRQEEIYSMQQGAAQPHIYPSDLKRLSIADAPEPVWQSLEKLLAPMFALIRNNEQESQTLAATRDLLLPKLMSGEIRLTGAEGAA